MYGDATGLYKDSLPLLLYLFLLTINDPMRLLSSVAVKAKDFFGDLISITYKSQRNVTILILNSSFKTVL